MTTTTIQEIEEKIATLSPAELGELYLWLDQHCPQPIDLQIEADFDAGRLDAVIQEALADAQAGRTRPFPR